MINMINKNDTVNNNNNSYFPLKGYNITNDEKINVTPKERMCNG